MQARAAALIGALTITTALGTAACDHSAPSAPPLSPSQPSPPVSPNPVPNPVNQIATVSGVVWLHDAGGVKPYASVNVWGWVQMDRSGYRIGPVTSGVDGRYTLTVPLGALLRVQVAAASQPCVTAATGNATHDVHIIVDPAQLGAHLPMELLADTPTLAGMVFETTVQGRQPVSGVRVELDMLDGMGDVSATTLTDSEGRYVLCGLGGAASTYVYASKSGYALADVGTVRLNGNTIRDIELHR
jgi:hypothetical protein